MGTLKQALKSQVTFTFENTDSANAKRLCLFPGHFNTQELIVSVNSSTTDVKNVVMANSSVANITAAGYACDQVAYDYVAGQRSTDKIQVTPNSQRTKYEDFLNYIKLNGLSVTKMRIRNLNQNVEIFDQEMEVSASAVGGKNGSDFITFSEYVSPNAYDRTFIDIDLKNQNLVLDNTTLAFLTMPASAKMSIQFTIE